MFGPFSAAPHSPSHASLKGSGHVTQIIPGSGQSAASPQVIKHGSGTLPSSGQIVCNWNEDSGQRSPAHPGPYSRHSGPQIDAPSDCTLNVHSFPAGHGPYISRPSPPSSSPLVATAVVAASVVASPVELAVDVLALVVGAASIVVAAVSPAPVVPALSVSPGEGGPQASRRPRNTPDKSRIER